MAIGSSSPFDHNAFAAASGLTSSPWAKQPNHSYIHKAETQTFNAPPAAPSAPTTPKKRWKQVFKTSTTNHVPTSGIVGGKRAFRFTTKNCSNKGYNGYTVCEDKELGYGYRTSSSGAGKLVPTIGYRLSGCN